MKNRRNRDKNNGSAASPRRRRLTPSRLLPFVTVILAGGWLVADWWYVLPDEVQATYVGRQSCVRCHQAEAERYQGSDHDRAMDLANEQTVLADFNDVRFTHQGLTSRMFRRDGKFMVETDGPDGELHEYEVKYVLGVNPLQQYMVEMNRPTDMSDDAISRVQVLRLSWDTQRREWFYLPPPDVSERLEPDDELHWTGITQCWNTSCAECHSTNLQKNFDSKTNTYHTTYSEIDVSCEACHGPGSVHVQLAESRKIFWDRKRGYGLPKSREASAEQQVQVCAQCHAHRQSVYPDFQPGEPFLDHYLPQLLIDTQGVSLYHADGQIREEVYEYGSFLQSKMYHKNIRCTDCHDPHSGRPKHAGNKLCTSCHAHPAGKYDAVSHHHHVPDKPGSNCVDCHMPVTHYMEVDPRRDHSLRVPRPSLSLNLGTPNACTGCHIDKSKISNDKHVSLKQYADWMRLARDGDEEIRNELARIDRSMHKAVLEWYGEKSDQDAALHYANQFAKALTEASQREASLSSLVRDANLPAIVRATAMANLRDQNSDSTLELALQSLEDREELVRVTAIYRLEHELDRLLPQLEASGNAGEQAARFRKIIERLQTLLEAKQRLVRVTAARSLVRLPAAVRDREIPGTIRRQMWSALEELKEGYQANSERAGAHMGLAALAESAGNLQEAASEYRAAIAVEPRVAGPRSNLATLLENQSQATERELRRAVQSGMRNEAESLAAEWERTQQAVRELRKQELEFLHRDARFFPKNAPLQYRYALALYLDGQESLAEQTLLQVIDLAPTMPDARFALVLLYQKLNRIDDAKVHAQELVRRFPNDRTYADLLRSLSAPPTPQP
ncbi:MAG: hypothetical protein RIS70_4046 [Planctomycetota bacterium]